METRKSSRKVISTTVVFDSLALQREYLIEQLKGHLKVAEAYRLNRIAKYTAEAIVALMRCR